MAGTATSAAATTPPRPCPWCRRSAKSHTATTCAVTPSSPTFGQVVTFTARVIALLPGAGLPSGGVTFTDGTVTVGTASLDGTGHATFTTATLNAGGHAISADYIGDSSFSGSAPAKAYGYIVSRAGTTTSGVTSSVDASVHEQAITLSVTISALAPGASVPAGTVTFSDQGGTLGKAPLNGSGLATLTTSTLPTSANTITASYGGDSNFSGSNDSASTMPLVQTVGKAHTATTFTVTPSSPTFGQVVTFTARVIALLPGAGLPSGGVTFTDGTVTVGTASLDGTGHATFTTATLNAGGHAISASYIGDSNFSGSAPAKAYGYVVSRAGTTTTVSSSVGSTSFGQLATFTAIVGAVSPGAGTPAGNVVFKDGTVALWAAALQLVSGTDCAIFVTKALATGSHTIAAVYQGNSNFLSSTAPGISQTVKQDDSVVRIAGSPAPPSVFHEAVTFTAIVVAASPGSGTPTGTVIFKDALIKGGVTMTSALATVTLGAGTATYSTSSLAVGNHVITAVYGGDANFAGVTSIGYGQSVRASGASATTVIPAIVRSLAMAASPGNNSGPIAGNRSPASNSVTATDAVVSSLRAAGVDCYFASLPRTGQNAATPQSGRIPPRRKEEWPEV